MKLKNLITEAVVVDSMFDIEKELLSIKESLLEQVIMEGVDDPGILKCVFMAGGPGSGKSFTAMEIFGIDKRLKQSFAATGLKSVNSDAAFEAGLKKNGINPKDLARIEREEPELWDKVTKEYIDKNSINEQDLIYGAIAGLVEKLDDPYSIFLEPSDSNSYLEALEGEFEGIGMVETKGAVDFLLESLFDVKSQK